MSSLKKKTDIFHKGFNSSTCKTSLKLAASRLKLLRNRREAQVKVLKREVAQLLEAGQEDRARVKVEHVIREEKAMSAYELIELYCEIIAARLQIIESQKHCPIDLKEAVSSVIFAQARCADLPELKDVRKNLTRKFGKDFADAAAELRPDSGVSSLIVEKLSSKSPSIEAKIKALTTIATEHDIDWKPKLMEQQLQKPKEEGFLDGPSTFQLATKLTTEPAKPEFVPQAAQKHVSVLNPIQPQASSTHGDSSSSPEQKFKETESVYVQSEEQHTTLRQQYWSTDFKDATAAAEAAAKSAEMANLAAKAAADLALRGNVPRPHVSVSDEYNQPPSEVSLKSQPSEPIIRKPIRSDMRTESTYKENSRIEGPQHGGVVQDGRNRKPEKEYYVNSRSSRIKPLPNSSSLKDGDEPVVMSGKEDDPFHKKSSFDHVTVKPYQVNEKIERNDDDIEYDRTDTYYRSPRSEDQQGQRAPRGKPVEETKNYKQIDRKTSTHLENLSEDRQGPGNRKHTPSEELANDLNPFQSEGSFSSAASQPGTNFFNDRSSSRRATSSVASPDFVVDNARGAARIQEPFVTIASQKSEQEAVRHNSEKEGIDVQDYDEKSYSRISSRANSSSLKSAFDESSSSFQDFTHDRHRVKTWEEHVANEENTNDFLSISNSPRSRKYVYNYDRYQYNERHDSLQHSFSSEEVVAQSYGKDEGPDVRGVDVKGKDNTFYSASGTIPFEDEVASIQSEEDPNEFISEFGADGRWQTGDRQGSSSCLPKPAFDDGDSDDGHRVNLDKIPSDDETEPMSNESGIFLSHASPVQPVRLESEYIMKSMSMETHEKDIAPVVFDNYDDYDRDSDSGDIDSSTKRTSLKDRSLSTISAKSSSSHETDREVRLREKEGKPSDMLSRDSSSRGLETSSSGRKKWDVPTRRKQSTHQYTHDETNIQEHSEEATAERMEMAYNIEDSESGMGLRLGGLRGGMRNNRTLQDPPYFSHPVGEKGLSFKETSVTNRRAENVEEPAKRKTILISKHSSRASSVENVSDSDESSDGGKFDNAGVSLRPKHLSEAIKVKQVGYNRPETLVTDEGSPQRLARRSQVDESADYHTPTLSRRNRKHAKNLDESTTIVEETSATAFYEPSKSERFGRNERLPSIRSKGGPRSSASSYAVPVSEEVDPQPWRSVGGSWRTKPPATESSRGEFPGKESSDQGLLLTNKNRRGGRVITSPSESEEEVDCQTERPAARGGARGSRRTSVSSVVSVKEKLPSKDNSDQNLPSRGKNETGYGRSTSHVEVDGEGEVDNRSWSQTFKHTLSDRKLSDRSLLPRESNESGLRSSLLSNDVDVDRMMNSQPRPSEKLTSRRTRVPTEDSLGQKFPGQTTDQRKARERSEHGYGGSMPSHDPLLDDEINTLPQPSVLGGDKFRSRRTRVLADERSRKETPEQEMDQHHHRAVGRLREKEASRTGLTRDSKTSIQEKDLDDNDALEVKPKPYSKLSSFSSAEMRSTPVPRSTVSGPERENAKSPQHRATPRTLSTELEIKESLKASSSAAVQGSTIKVDAKLTESKTTEQPPMPPTRDLKQKETQSAPLSDAGLSRTASSNGKDTSSEKKAPAHVHPKLPSDFDSFVASFRSLRANTRKN